MSDIKIKAKLKFYSAPMELSKIIAINDAPADSITYGRKNNAWTNIDTRFDNLQLATNMKVAKIEQPTIVYVTDENKQNTSLMYSKNGSSDTIVQRGLSGKIIAGINATDETDSVFEVGAGTAEQASTIFSVKYNGNIESKGSMNITGTIQVGNDPVNDLDVSTKHYADSKQSKLSEGSGISIDDNVIGIIPATNSDIDALFGEV